MATETDYPVPLLLPGSPPQQGQQAWKLLDGCLSEQGVLRQPEHLQVGGVAQDAAESGVSEAVGSPQGQHLQPVQGASTCQGCSCAFCEAPPTERELQPLQPGQDTLVKEWKRADCNAGRGSEAAHD